MLLSGCASTRPAAPGDASDAIYDELGTHHRAVTTAAVDAQRWFDRGLVLLYAFNHDEAVKCFERALSSDPGCASAAWGIALALGPHINNAAMTPADSERAWLALQRARAAASGASGVERDLIEALGRRYAWPAPENRAPLDEAYADAMRAVWRAHPSDADVGALCAEALMDLHPWDLWASNGVARPWTGEIVTMLERVLEIDPAHPLANHLHVHALEASPDPARASAAADRLRALVPGASHLVHMPAHIDARVGRWAEAARANEDAIAVDARYAGRTGRAGFYRLYMAHNLHFLTFVSMMEGRKQRSLEAARSVASGFTPELLERLGPFVDGFLPIVLEVQVRFGMWEEILREPPFPALFGVSNAVRHYARGVALTALGRFDAARDELRALEELCAVMDERPIGNNPARTVLEIPRLVLSGELAFREGHRDQGLDFLRQAVAVEDSLLYDEPPDWIMPVRHTLGAALVAAGRFEEAERAYAEDLARWPRNGWSLLGALRCAEGLGREQNALDLRTEFEKAWARADVHLTASCFCQAIPE